MPKFFFEIILNHSIIIPAITAGVRFKHIPKSFYPFIFLIWIGFVNESLSLLFIYLYKTNAANSNLYVLIEYVVILYMFYRWHAYRKIRYVIFNILGALVWVGDNLIINSVTQNNSIFRIYYSIIIACLSIDRISQSVVYRKGNLLADARFIIFMTFLMYFGIKSFVEVFNAFRLDLSNHFYNSLWMILYIANAVSNILYTLAILCIRPKEEFTLQY